MKKIFSILIIVFLFSYLYAQTELTRVTVYPKEIFYVLNNPGIGFTIFQRFNGDELNPGRGWTEGLPIEYQSTRTVL